MIATIVTKFIHMIVILLSMLKNTIERYNINVVIFIDLLYKASENKLERNHFCVFIMRRKIMFTFLT